MTRYLLGVIVLVVGIAFAFQSPINASLARRTGAVQASAVSFAVGALALFCVSAIIAALAQRQFLGGVAGAPWWMFVGGLIGAVFVTTMTFLVPRLGAAGLIAGIIAGQLIGSMLIDQLGLFGLERNTITGPRFIGAALLLGGAALVIRR